MKNLKKLFSFALISFLFACASQDDDVIQSSTPCEISSLTFNQVLSFSSNSNCIDNGVNGAAINIANNVLYFSNRGLSPNQQELITIDLTALSSSSSLGAPADFCTTRPVFTNSGSVVVPGVTRISTYGGDGSYVGTSNYTSHPFGLGNWFDVTYNPTNGLMYYIGVRDDISLIAGTNNIRTLDINAGSTSLSSIGSIANTVTRAAIEYHDNNLYIFGGYNDDNLLVPSSTFIKYNLSNNTESSVSLPAGGVNSGYLTVAGSCIFAGGMDHSLTTILFYKYNTTDNTIGQLSHNLTGEILAMISSDTKLYVITQPGAAGTYLLFEANLI